MTAKQCHQATGQPLKFCEAYVRAGLTLKDVSNWKASYHEFFTAKETAALNRFYVTPLPEMPECSPTCVMCHPELYDRRSPDGRRH
jgi:hypothetical protein